MYTRLQDRRVLLVESDDLAAEAISPALERFGVAVARRSTLGATFSLLEAEGLPVFAALVVDLGMPSDGKFDSALQLMLAIHDRRGRLALRWIALSNRDDPWRRAAARQAHAAAFVVKSTGAAEKIANALLVSLDERATTTTDPEARVRCEAAWRSGLGLNDEQCLVAFCLLEEMPRKQIAATTQISPGRIPHILDSLRKAAGKRTRAGIVQRLMAAVQL